MKPNPQINESTATGNGFQISPEPVVQTTHDPQAGDELPASYGMDMLYAIARDPGTLFVYWDLSWPRLFERAGVSPRPVHLRTYREDGSIEETRATNPFRGHCYVAVTAPGATYYCEIGCFAGADWKTLARSDGAVTPQATLSEDFSEAFATLPLHLSFQRLLDIFNQTQANRETLAMSVAKFQTRLRPAGMTLKEPESSAWEQLIACARPLPAARGSDEERAKWEEVTRRVLAETDLGGSSLA